MQTLRLCPYVEVKKEIKILNQSKGSQEKNVPSENFNPTINSDIFPDLLKEANVNLMFKKDSQNDKEIIGL